MVEMIHMSGGNGLTDQKMPPITKEITALNQNRYQTPQKSIPPS